MTEWIVVDRFNIPSGRFDPILVPHLLSETFIAIKVSDPLRRNWRKAGDLWQQFDGGFRGEQKFVPLKDQIALPMITDLGAYHLRFQPVDYHKGLFVEVWKWFAPPIPTFETRYLAINSGAGLITGADGLSWIADQYFAGGITYSFTGSVGNTLDDDLVRSVREGSFSYNIPTLDNSLHEVSLFFVEDYWQLVNKRKFRVEINGVMLLNNFDVFAEVGFRILTQRSFVVTPLNQSIFIEFTTLIDSAMISAILIKK